MILNSFIYILECIYHLLLISITYSGFKNFKKLSKDKIIIFLLFLITMLTEWFGILLSYFKQPNKSVYLIYDYFSVNITILFYLNNFRIFINNRRKSYYLFLFNTIFFIADIFIFRKLVSIDTIYTIFFSFVYIILGLLLLLEHLSISNKSKQVLGINFLFVYFALVTLCYKFLAYEFYLLNYEFKVLQLISYLLNIAGFTYVLLLIKKGNENNI